MLNEILVEMVAMYGDRIQTQTAYCGYGTSLYCMVDDYFEAAGWNTKTRRIIRRLEEIAYNRAMEART